MTELRNDGKTSAAEAMKFWEEFRLPEMGATNGTVLLGMMQNAVLLLQNGLLPGAWLGKPVFDWKNPRIANTWEMVPFGLIFEEAQALAQYIIDKLLINGEPGFILSLLTAGIVQVYEEDGKSFIIYPPDSEAGRIIEALPEAERVTKANKLADGYKFPPLEIFGTVDTPEGKQAFRVALVFQAIPLRLKLKPRKAYYQLFADLDIIEGNPSTWPEESQKALFAGFIKKLDELTAPFLAELNGKGEKPPVIPPPSQTQPGRPKDFVVAAGIVPFHKLAERSKAGLLLFPDERRQFYSLRTSLNWATSLAMMYFTSPDNPGDWQEARVSDLEDRIYCLTERDAPRRGDHRTDILAEVVKLFTETQALVLPRWEKCGRVWKSRVDLRLFRIVAELGLSYLDKNTSRIVQANDPSLRSYVVPFEIKGRRVYQPDGKEIKALLGNRFTLDRIGWRWTPSLVDDLLNAPAQDGKGQIKRDSSGKILRGGYNIRTTVKIFEALNQLRAEKAYVAHDLLILLAHDIYKPPKQSASAGRNVIEREAGRLYDLLGLDDDQGHPARRKETVAAAINRLKQADIGALLPDTKEYPRTSSSPDRRRAPYYCLIRSPLYTPAGIITTKEEGEAIEAESTAPGLPPVKKESQTEQTALPGLEQTALPIPSGSEIRAAREAAGVNLRDFADMMKGPSFKTWSLIETGQRSENASRISEEVWQRVREFVAQHCKTGLKDA